MSVVVDPDNLISVGAVFSICDVVSKVSDAPPTPSVTFFAYVSTVSAKTETTLKIAAFSASVEVVVRDLICVATSSIST